MAQSTNLLSSKSAWMRLKSGGDGHNQAIGVEYNVLHSINYTVFVHVNYGNFQPFRR